MKEIIKKISKTFLLVIIWLVVFDAGTQILLKALNNERLNNFFSYGMSTEMQLRNMFEGDIPDDSVLHAGWIDEDKFRNRGTKSDVTFYGMSFSNHIADQLINIDNELAVRKIDGPASPLNHSVSSFLVDKDICRSDVVVLGVLDSSLKYLESMTNDTIGNDTAMGSFYPRFVKSSEGLKQVYPEINSFNELQTCISNSGLWNKNINMLKSYDKSYSSFIYKKNVLDYSVIGRFIKRWYKSKHNRMIIDKTFYGNEFNKEILFQAEELISLFAKEAKASGSIPFIILIETQHYGDALGTSLSPFLDELEVDYMNTGDIVSTTIPSNYMSDGHITVENNRKLAVELDRIIKILK